MLVMPKSVNPFRMARCRGCGGEVLLVKDVQQAFAKVEELKQDEGRVFVHPFEGPLTAPGTATIGLEFMRQAPGLDAVSIPTGGGGLCAGMAAAIKQIDPRRLVFGVAPVGADSTYRSLQAGAPQSIDRVRTIADSLGAPDALPYRVERCRRFVDEIVLIDDDAMHRATGLLCGSMKTGRGADRRTRRAASRAAGRETGWLDRRRRRN